MDLEPFCGESTNKGERSGRDWDKEGMAGTGGSRTTSLLCPSSQNHIRSATIVESQYNVESNSKVIAAAAGGLTLHGRPAAN